MNYVKRVVSRHRDIVANLPAIFCTDDSEWDYIDDRFNSYYGSTFEIPTSDYITDLDKNSKIAVLCDRFLLTDVTWFPVHFATSSDYTYLNVRYDVSNKYKSFIDVLKEMSFNVDVVGNYSSTSTTYNTLDDVINYLNTYTPDYLIFNGVEGSLLSGVSFSQCISKLNIINTICASNSIKALLIYTPNYDIMNMSEKDYQKIICTYFSNLEILDIGNWFIHHLELDKLDKSSFDSKTSNYCDQNYRYILDLSNVSIDDTQRYSVVVYNKIKKYVLENFLGLKRTSFYISFVSLTVDNSLYHRTCKYYDNTPASKIFGRKYTSTGQGKDGLRTELGEHDMLPDGTDIDIHFITKYGSDKAWNIFANNGELIQFGIHTSYDESRFMAQQLQCNCSEEFQKARESPGITINNLMRIRKYSTGGKESELTALPPPVFPGTGCPWITISERNIESYKESTGRYCPRYVYYTKDKYSCTITVRLHSDQGLPDLWQSVSVGMMEAERAENYPFPLFACGGTQAIKQDHYQYVPIGGKYLTFLTGNSYDLDMDSICLCNSNALHSTKFNGSESSTFKFLTPEGLWQPIWVHSQSIDGPQGNPRKSGPPTDYASPLGEPSPTISGVCTIYPNNTDSRYTCSVTSKYQELEPYARDNLHNGTKLENITIINESSRTHESKIIVGILPNMYRSWDDELPCGEIIIDNIRYLSIPNGWEHRMWHYPYHWQIHNDEWEIDVVRDLFSDIAVPKRYKIFNDRLLIRLGDEIDDT